MYERWKQMEEDELKEEEGCQAGDGWSREGGGGQLGRPRWFCCQSSKEAEMLRRHHGMMDMKGKGCYTLLLHIYLCHLIHSRHICTVFSQQAHHTVYLDGFTQIHTRLCV